MLKEQESKYFFAIFELQNLYNLAFWYCMKGVNLEGASHNNIVLKVQGH